MRRQLPDRYKSFEPFCANVVHQNAVCVIGVALLALSFDAKIIELARLPAHSQARNFNRPILAILECDRLSLCKTRRQFIGKRKVVIFAAVATAVLVEIVDSVSVGGSVRSK